MKLDDLRERIDKIDDRILELFQDRMKIAADVAEYKKVNKLPVLDSSREREKLLDIAEKSEENLKSYSQILFSNLMELSRSYQKKHDQKESELVAEIENAIEHTEKILPKSVTVACQGVEGAFSQLACDKLFGMPKILYFKSFEGVFSAIDKGLCNYGVLPIENSIAGSVNKVYDLMMKYHFNIVRSVRIKVNHNLLAKKGTKLSQIREVFSHEQAINQCSEFLNGLTGVKVTVCENTAMAAKMVSESERADVAAISSSSCEELYGLDSICDSIQDKDNNYSRFICISKKMEIYPGASLTSVMMILPNKPGSLYKVLARFYTLGVNLVKLESRPLPDRNFEFMFYFDFEISVYSEEFRQLIAELDDISEEYRYLGSYSELI